MTCGKRTRRSPSSDQCPTPAHVQQMNICIRTNVHSGFDFVVMYGTYLKVQVPFVTKIQGKQRRIGIYLVLEARAKGSGHAASGDRHESRGRASEGEEKGGGKLHFGLTFCVYVL